MSESQTAPNAAEPASAAPKADAASSKPSSKPLKPQNPALKAMGLPRMRLPSRNWTIFLTLSTSLAAAIIYDKRETKRAQKKWCKLVEHLAHEPLPDNKVMPRKLRVFLEAPPEDGLRIAQDHFKEYVKPILVASGVDWEFVQGRREGDIRAELAERIRRERLGEVLEDGTVEDIRRNVGIKEFDGTKGDIVIGRHTWKEYVRGIHEGWLGPLERPAPVATPNPEEPKKSEEKIETLPGITIHDSPSDSESPKAETPAEEKDKPVEKLPPTPPYISTSEYKTASLPANIPTEFDPAYPTPFPHILGFFNTHIRLQRFLTRRRLADSIGRDVAAVILSTNRPYSTSGESSFIADDQSPASSSFAEESGIEVVKAEKSEIPEALAHEERDWHKDVYKTPTPESSDINSSSAVSKPEVERTWIKPIITDPRIASRMRRPELSAEDETRATGIVVTEEEIEGNIKGGLRWLWRWGSGGLEKGEKGRNEDMHRRNKALSENVEE